jgi:hypothetical protein
MFRHLYHFVVLAHPASFRQRFGEEMLSIFDQSEGKLSRVGLLADGVVSLLRQWALRPDFLQETAATAGDHSAAGMEFDTSGRRKVRGYASVVYGSGPSHSNVQRSGHF